MIALRFLPPEVFLLALMFIGLGLIVGLLKRQKAFAAVGLVCFLAILQPFVPALMALVPWWVYLIVLPIAVIGAARAAVSAVLGKHAASHMIGVLAADAVKWVLGKFFKRGGVGGAP